MTHQKKGFLLYLDSLCILEELTDEQAGKLIKTIHYYQSKKELPENLDQITKLIVIPFIKQFERDEEKWNETINKKSNNGKIGNLKRWNEDLYKKVIAEEMTLDEAETIAKHRKTSLSDNSESQKSQTIANIAVNDSVSVNVNDSVNNNKNKKTKAKKYNDFHFSIANELGSFVKNHYKKNLTMGNIKKWADDIRLLQEEDLSPRENSEEDIKKAMKSIIENTGKPYFVTVQSGTAFRKKFISIEDYSSRENKQSKPPININTNNYDYGTSGKF